jgi:hypothetical protein
VRGADVRERVVAVARAHDGREERQPQALLAVLGGRRLGVGAGRVGGQLREARGREGQLVGQALRVGGRLQAGDEPRAVAVVGRAGHLTDADAATPRGRRS